jgi:TetR/AcrR family transcriptional regulator, cholesterol catabolism regulator
MEPKTSVETHNRIQDQAKILFMRYGIRSVSMDDIAGGLGMSKKTIYQFFADKDELVDAIIEPISGICALIATIALPDL